MRKFASIFALGSALIAAGCQSQTASRSPNGVDGDWVDTEGVGLSTFSGGSFSTVAMDTGNRLSDGSYQYLDQRTIVINIRSIVRNTTATANCSLVSQTQMNCTMATGAQFTLVRRGNVS